MAIVNAFQSYSRYTTNAASYTLASHQTPVGANVTLVVAGLFLRTTETDFTISSVTWNGAAMTSQVQATSSSPSRWYRAGIWSINLGDVGSYVTADVVATASATIAGAVLCAVTLTGCYQQAPITSFDTNVPAVITASISTWPSPWAIYAACAHSSNAGWAATSSEISPVEIFDLPGTLDASTEISAAAWEYTWPGTDSASASVTMNRTGTPPAIAAVAAKFRAAVPASLLLSRRPRTYVRM